MLPPAANEHIEGCDGCRSLVDVLAQPSDPVRPQLVSEISARLNQQLQPVTPLPSDPVLVLFTFSIFVVFCLSVGAAVRLFGYSAMTPEERLLYYGLISVLGLCFAIAVVATSVPASKTRIPPWMIEAGSAVLVALLVTVLFPSFHGYRFVSRGIPCLRLGCICAALFALLSTVLLRRGYVVAPRRTAILIGCFAGFSGVAVLALHCPLLDAAHILVWHLGAMAVSALAGAAIGFRLHTRT